LMRSHKAMRTPYVVTLFLQQCRSYQPGRGDRTLLRGLAQLLPLPGRALLECSSDRISGCPGGGCVDGMVVPAEGEATRRKCRSGKRDQGSLSAPASLARRAVAPGADADRPLHDGLGTPHQGRCGRIAPGRVAAGRRALAFVAGGDEVQRRVQDRRVHLVRRRRSCRRDAERTGPRGHGLEQARSGLGGPPASVAGLQPREPVLRRHQAVGAQWGLVLQWAAEESALL